MYSRMCAINKNFHNLTPISKTVTMLCPTTVVTTKLVNKFVQLVFKIRKQLDEGVPALNLGFEKGEIYPNIFSNNNCDSDDEN